MVEALGEPDRGRRLALAERRRRDRGDQDVLAARPLRLEAGDRLERHLGLGRAVQLELVVGDAEVVRDVDDRARRDGSGDLEVGREAHRSPRRGVRRRSRASGRTWRSVGACGSLTLGGADQVGEQQGVGQRPDAAGHRRDRRCDLDRRGEVHVADDLAVDDVDPDVDDDGAGLEHRPGDEAGPTGGDDDDVGACDVVREVARPRVADGDRRVLLDEEEGGRHADDGRAADDDGVRAGDLDPRASQDLDGGVGRRRQEPVVAEAQQAGVERVDAVDVLGRVDRVDDGAQPDRRRERHLDDDAVDAGVGVERRGWSPSRGPRSLRPRARRTRRRCRPCRSRAGSARGRPSTARRDRR